MDVAHNNTRGSSQRLREKREKIRQATHRPSSERDIPLRDALHSSQDRVRALEQQLRAAEQRAQDAEQRERVTQRHCQESKEQLKNYVRDELFRIAVRTLRDDSLRVRPDSEKPYKHLKSVLREEKPGADH